MLFQREPYSFSYEVDAPHYGTFFDRNEVNDGELTQGRWRVALPDHRMQTVTYTAGKDGFEAQISYQPHPDFESLRSSLGKPKIGQSVVRPLPSRKNEGVTAAPLENTYDHDFAESNEVFTYGGLDQADDFAFTTSSFHDSPKPTKAPKPRISTVRKFKHQPSTARPKLPGPIAAPLRTKVKPTPISKLIPKPIFNQHQGTRRPKPKGHRQSRLFDAQSNVTPSSLTSGQLHVQNQEPLLTNTGRNVNTDAQSLNQLYKDLKYPAHIISRLPVTFEPLSSSEALVLSGSKNEKKYFIMDRENVLKRLQAIVHGQDLMLVSNTKG